jgi:hypothetical protein
MLYLDNTTEAQGVLVPRDGQSAEGLDLHFRAVSTVDLSTLLDTPVSDLGTSGQYFRIAVELPEGAADGEYEYTLSGNGVTLSTGLLCVGELPDVTRSEYNKSIEYEQYEK